MPCLAANAFARIGSLAATASTIISECEEAGTMSPIGAIQAAPKMPILIASADF